jgi:hypothetical protein
MKDKFIEVIPTTNGPSRFIYPISHKKSALINSSLGQIALELEHTQGALSILRDLVPLPQ